MVANPEMVGGSRDRIDTSLMKALPGRIVSKGGMEALRGLAILGGARSRMAGARAPDRPGWRSRSRTATATIGGRGRRPSRRSARPASSTAPPLRELARYHRPASLDPHGRLAAEAVPEFELAPVGELTG